MTLAEVRAMVGEQGGPSPEAPKCCAWDEIAAQESRNRDYYRGLVVEIGRMLGPAAYTADDGTVNDDILCAKVPELVRARLSERSDGSPLARLTEERDAALAQMRARDIVMAGQDRLYDLVTEERDRALMEAKVMAADITRFDAENHALREERDRAEITLTRAQGALADAATVTTGNIEAGIRALIGERDLLSKVAKAADRWRERKGHDAHHDCDLCNALREWKAALRPPDGPDA